MNRRPGENSVTKRKGKLFFFIFTILCLVLFREPLLRFTVDKTCEHFFAENKIFYEKLKWDREGISLQGVSIEGKGFFLEIPRLALSFSLKPVNLHLGVHLLASHPQVIIKERSSAQDTNLLAPPFLMGKHFSINLEAEQGEVFFQKGLSLHEISPIYFSASTWGEKDNITKLLFYGQTSKRDNPELSVEIEPQGEVFSLRCKLEKTEASRLLEIASFFMPSLASDWENMQGQVEVAGECVVDSKGKINEMHSQIDIRELRIDNHSLGLHAIASGFRFDFSFPGSKDDSLPFWKKLVSSIVVREGEILLEEPLTSKSIGIKDFNLEFATSFDKEPSLEMQGILLSKQNESPFHMQGSGKISDEEVFCLETSLSLHDRNQETLQLFATLCPCGEGQYQLQTDFKNCTADHLLLIEDILQQSLFQEYAKLSHGVVDGKCLALMQDSKWSLLKLEDLHAREMKFQFPGVNQDISFPEMQGNIELIRTEDTWKVSSAQLDCREGVIDFSHTGEQADTLKDVFFHLHLEKEKLKSSFFQAKLGESQVLLEAEGFPKDFLVKAHVNAATLDVRKMISSHLPQLSSYVPKEEKLQITSLFHFEADKKKVSGNVSFLSAEAIQEKLSEVLEFSLDLKTDFFENGLFESSLLSKGLVQSGRFRMNHLSSDLLSPFITSLSPTSKMQGDFFLEGTFTPQVLQIYLGGKEIVWQDGLTKITLPALGDPEFSLQSLDHFLHLRYFFHDQNWSMEFPLHDVQISDESSQCEGKHIEGRGMLTSHKLGKECSLQAVLQSGDWTIGPDLALKNMKIKALYDSKSQKTSFSDIIADLSWKKSYGYILQAEKCIFDGLSQNAQFDVKVLQDQKEVLRFAGKAEQKKNEIDMHFSPDKTHIVGTFCNISSCKLLPSFEVSTLKMNPELTLSTFPGLVLLLDDVAGFSLDEKVKEALLSSKMDGKLLSEITYHAPSKTWRFSAHGRNLFLLGKARDKFSVSLMSVNNICSLDRLECDDLFAKAVIQKKDHIISFSSLEAVNEKISVKASGMLDLKQQKANIMLQNCMINATDEKNELPGIFKCLGEVQVDLSEKVDLWQAEGLVHVSFSEKLSDEMFVKTKKELSFTASPKQGIKFDEGLFLVEDLVGRRSLGMFKIYNFSSSLSLHEWGVDLIEFSLSPYLKEFLQKKQGYASFAENVTWKGFIEGECSAHFSENKLESKGKVKEGNIAFTSLPIEVKDLSWKYQSQNILFDGKLLYDKILLGAHGKMNFLSEPKLLIQISSYEQNSGITAEFMQANQSFFCKSVQGTLFGVTLDMKQKAAPNSAHPVVFSGEMHFDVDHMQGILSKEDFIELKKMGLGKGFHLEGDWKISQNGPSKVEFSGKLVGEDFDLLGYKFENYHSLVDVAQDRILIRDIEITDPAGKVSVKQAKVEKQEDEWNLHVPHLKVQNFHPTKLKNKYAVESSVKPFVLRHVDFFDIKGHLGDLDSITAKGYAHFTNLAPKTSSFFSIPKEMLKNLGFDLGLFVPISGEIICQVHNKKLYLDELKNSFSEGKRSEFSLFPSEMKSFIDFQGNVYIDVKMKQNVALKITEPFILQIRGTVKDPKYSLSAP